MKNTKAIDTKNAFCFQLKKKKDRGKLFILKDTFPVFSTGVVSPLCSVLGHVFSGLCLILNSDGQVYTQRSYVCNS